MSLKTYKQIIKSEVIVILRRVFPPLYGGQSKVLKAVFFKSLSDSFLLRSVIPGRFSFLFLPSQFYLKWGASRARASPQSASAMLPCEATPTSDGPTTTGLTRGLPGFGGVEK